jgi:hypothetical protein
MKTTEVDRLLKWVQTAFVIAFLAVIVAGILSVVGITQPLSLIPSYATLAIILGSIAVYAVRASLKRESAKSKQILWWLLPVAFAVLFAGNVAGTVQAQSAQCQIIYVATVQCLTIPLPDWLNFLNIVIHLPAPVCWISWIPVPIGNCNPNPLMAAPRH